MPKLQLEELVWTCGDCGNIYSFDIRYCPNYLIDNLLVKELITKEELNGCR